jgi:hypothetical protein
MPEKKGRGFGELAKKTLTRPASMKEFLENGDPEKPETANVASKPAKKSNSPEPEPTPINTTPKSKRESKSTDEAKDRRTIYFSAMGSDALDELELYARKLAGTANKSKVNLSLVVDLAVRVVQSQIKNNRDDNSFNDFFFDISSGWK